MKRWQFSLCFLVALLVCEPSWLSAAARPLFDGKTFAGWEGDTETVWRIRDGVIVGGSMAGNPQNEFLATKESFGNFHLRFEYKLVGTEGFINGGVQFRSRRIEDPPNEMIGYQADIGAGYSGFLYDESRRRRFLAEADADFVARLERPGEWNSGEVVADGKQVLLFINGQRTSIWVEREEGIPLEGKIALQIHGGCKAEISFRNITIEALPASAVPPEAERLSRFGRAQPSAPLPGFAGRQFRVEPGEVIAFVGQENFVRDQKAAALEPFLALAFSDQRPRFRPMAWEADTVYEQWRDLNFGGWAEQFTAAGVTAVMAQYGQMEALDGVGRLPEFVAAYHRLLDEFATRTQRVVLISPMPFERPLAPNAPDLSLRNEDVSAYAEAVGEIARLRGAVFVDLFRAASQLDSKDRLTRDGIHLTDHGLSVVGRLVAKALTGTVPSIAPRVELRDAIVKKNRYWFDCWRPANWSFVYGDRVNQMYGKPGGGEPSLQHAFERQLPLVEAADQRIHALAAGEVPKPMPIMERDVEAQAEPPALSPEAQLATFTVAEGYAVNLFASEREGVVNPTQMAWDENGALYVACSPSYPQTLASAEPSDYIQVVVDSDHDGVADRSWRFADGLAMVQGVEPGAGGVYVCDFDQLLHLQDTDGDGRADVRRVLFSGFGVGDTHQLINSICHGPNGSLWFTQGLHAMSRVETPWGIARLDRSAVWRLNPRTWRLEGYFGGGMAGANCWGVAFDDFGQVFHKSGDRPQGYWTVPGMVRGGSPSGSSSDQEASVSYRASPQQYHDVGPLFDTSPKTTALEIIGSRALPPEIQGTALIGGYFGAVVELHQFADVGSGFRTTQLPKLMRSSNNAFRPVDVSAGPDGGLYLADWYNPVIGHYQASYADPRRDKSQGRIWRVRAKGFPAVKQPNLADMSPEELLVQLASTERWTRYQAKRLLFDGPRDRVLKAADVWFKAYHSDRERMEVLGVYVAHEAVRPAFVRQLLEAKDWRVRAYAVRVVGLWAERLPEALSWLRRAVRDRAPRVRLEAVVAASYLPAAESVSVVTAAREQTLDPFLDYAIYQSARALQPYWEAALRQGELELDRASHQYLTGLLEADPPVASPGEEIYRLACLACHQPGGQGLPGVYPPLVGSEWVQSGQTDRLIKIVLHGLQGSLEVAGVHYGDQENAVPMPPLNGLSDQQVADVLNYIRSEWSDANETIDPSEVARVRAATAGRKQPWQASELD